MALPAEFAQRVGTGNNGMLSPTVVADGEEIIGTWKRARRGGQQTMLVTPFTSFAEPVHEEIIRRFEALP